MRVRTPRRLVYVVTGLSILAVTTGYALGGVGLGQVSREQQGSQTVTISAVTGIESLVEVLPEVETVQPLSTGCTLTSPCDVTSSNQTNCAGGDPGSTACAVGDTVEEVVLSTVVGTKFVGTVNVTLFVSNGSAVVPATSFYYAETAGPAEVTHIVQDFDIGTPSTGARTVTAIDVIVTVEQA
jgi:hypothetical protein